MLSNCVLEMTLENLLDSKEIKPVNLKGNQSWIFIGRTDAEAEAPILWPPDVKNQLIEKDPDAGKDWRQEEKGTTEDEMVGWHHPIGWMGVWTSSGSWWMDREAWRSAVHGVAKSWTWVTELHWIETKPVESYSVCPFVSALFSFAEYLQGSPCFSICQNLSHF